ncbi:SAM-dependent methyltransferase [Ovoidimarina sediminis]|uniref:SAM-dependent methyltransferase n=1 Tax=Ovoidimarina sediminis TaxID=3079856 RepID=UPI0029063D32|nr:class I SAM-dependent methyltransferase [Rhodophyticola sp. MJ-SS7]MDU8941796.1 class I SAM-dependent methyltransferase [Rhodophyticola sp. MJ-SS7]
MNEYDRWEGRFAAEHFVFGTEPNAFLARTAGRIPPGSRVLSVADGEGRNGVWLAEQGHDVLAQDFSPTAQDKARRLAAERGVTLEWELSDITARDWAPEAFDAVVGIFFQFLPPAARSDVLAGIVRTVKPGGIVLIEGYGPKQLDYGTGGPKALENLYTEALLREAFAGFKEVETAAYDAEIEEGPGHSGMSALVDLIARK